MDASLQPARTAEIVLEILQFLKQHEDVFAARSEIGRTRSAVGAQLLELSEQVRVPTVRRNVRRCRQRAQQPLQDRLGQESVPKHPD